MIAQKRMPAVRILIGDLLQGLHVHPDTQFLPQELVLQNNQSISRVALCGIIVQNTSDTSNPSMLLDDGTGVISLRTFEVSPTAQKILPGTPVFVIGKPRQFMNVSYVLTEILKELQNPCWLEVWKKTIKRITTLKQPELLEEKKEQSNKDEPDQFISVIREKDRGEGVDIDILVKENSIPDCENVIADLLLKGRVFEVSPGRIKVLE